MAPVTPAFNGLAGLIPRAASSEENPTRTFDARQVVVTITSTPETTAESASNNNLSGGAIAGIVIGSIAGFLILLWILKSCGLWKRPNSWGEPDEYDRKYDRKYRGRSPGARHHRRRQHRYHHETSRSRRPSYEVEEVRYAQPVVYEKRRPSASPRPPAAVYRSSRSRTRY
ncbi:hypothetical protein COL154_004162 [Colletotrichum chrysophilum]|uniref:Uncharacterized protein n=2 Tax=Colletotrichum gloeosporioides species complex TaxID=2707338 RepID=A0A9W4S2A2_9PEZI|nr:uncharacterized protein COL26b_003982 [Colletotrichum chrysophilum]KAH9239308.1 hypothetical protein K456DRAFT_49552 [Colletotrichum gloeosporioides 23]KAJ0285590.1 hypothetical protein COL940_003435 [Colletotrichum noveboracense]KAJ0288719.1 hypothetical protein CBS470a_004708 [Colletotrichum nupharicola]KAJ0318692.1 hypothetical protein Brms1b_004181 [Colletotrichum noveboracense]KAJ0351773.1 hypothetical protein KNSL1_003095 [Colletotrichum chrysophilum]